MSNVVKLYYTQRSDIAKEWELIPSKLFVIEDIASYLETKSSNCTTITNFQYVKNALELDINVDLSQIYAQPKATTSYKYVSIHNDGELIHYYFVKSAEWRSKTCVRFKLVLDVLNTFEENKDYTFKPNTRIIREHKDRLTIANITLNITSYEAINIEGSVGEDDEVDVFFQVGGIEYIICTGVCTYNDGDSMIINVDEGYSKNDINRLINAHQLQIFVRKDSENIYEIEVLSHNLTFDYCRNIDNIQENINPVLQCGNAQGRLAQDNDVLNCDWYLLYRNQNDPSDSLVNPVDCYLIPSEQKQTDSGVIANGRLIPSWLEEGKYYYFLIGSGETYTLSNGVSVSYNSVLTSQYILLTKSNGKINVIYFYKTAGQLIIKWQYDDIDYLTITGLPALYYKKDSFIELDDNYNITGTTSSFDNTEEYTILDSIDLLDRTDSKNIKLIKLPYCPYDFQVSGSTIRIDGNDDWELASLTQSGGGVANFLKLKELNTPLERNIPTNNDINPLSNFIVSDITPSLTNLRDTTHNLESKLYNSEFYAPKLVYDSFAYNIELEKLEQNQYYVSANRKLSIKFIMSRTINSKFMFKMTSLSFALSESNYPNYLPIARNNEEVLYNVPYINYIRSGYNYDIKNKNTAMASNIVGLGLSAASIGASLLMPSVPLKIAGVVGSLLSMAMSVKNTIVTTINNENSIRQKQEQYRNQASSVAGSDDVDLMSVYAENRLKYLVYEPTPRMKALVNDLFFYAGYNSGRIGLPNHKTRCNFDYLECEASIECLASMPEDCVNELINCFKAGVTYIHKTTRDTYKWDIAQTYENWENELLED